MNCCLPTCSPGRSRLGGLRFFSSVAAAFFSSVFFSSRSLGCVTASIVLGGLGTDPIAVAATSTAVYVGYDSGAIAVLDPTTLAVRHAYRLDTQDDQGGLAFANGSVWYPTFGSNTILRVKP